MGLSNYLPSSRISQSGVCTSSTRPASPFEGQVIYETDTDRVLVWNASVWKITNDLLNFSFTNDGAILSPNQWTYNGDNTGGAAVSFNGESVKPPNAHINVGSLFNVSTGRFTVPVAGYILCSFNSLITRPTNVAHAYVEFQVNGVRKSVRTHTVYDIGGNYQSLNNTAIVYCPENGYVTCNLWTPSGATAYADMYGLGLTFRWLG
jgi:hypothetical protein